MTQAAPDSGPFDTFIHRTLENTDLPAPPWTTLGMGVWGHVFDLGDGSVLKIVRRKGGIGSGAEIFDGEVAALKATHTLKGNVRTARLVAASAIHPQTEGLEEYCGWIHMSRLPGKTVSCLLSGDVATPAKEAVMRRLGEAAAQLHRQSAALVTDVPGLPALSQQRLQQIADSVPDMRSACADVGAVLAAGPQHPFLHGDINGGNALFSDPDNIATSSVGLVDWGEAQSGPIEIELRHMHDIGGPAEAMIEGYQAQGGAAPDPIRVAAALCLNALGTLAIATLGTVPGLDPETARTTVLERLKALT